MVAMLRKLRSAGFVIGLMLIASGLSSCQSTRPLYQSGVRPAQEPALPATWPQECMLEIVQYGRGEIHQISETCLAPMRVYLPPRTSTSASSSP